MHLIQPFMHEFLDERLCIESNSACVDSHTELNAAIYAIII